MVHTALAESSQKLAMSSTNTSSAAGLDQQETTKSSGNTEGDWVIVGGMRAIRLILAFFTIQTALIKPLCLRRRCCSPTITEC